MIWRFIFYYEKFVEWDDFDFGDVFDFIFLDRW